MDLKIDFSNSKSLVILQHTQKLPKVPQTPDHQALAKVLKDAVASENPINVDAAAVINMILTHRRGGFAMHSEITAEGIRQHHKKNRCRKKGFNNTKWGVLHNTLVSDMKVVAVAKKGDGRRLTVYRVVHPGILAHLTVDVDAQVREAIEFSDRGGEQPEGQDTDEDRISGANAGTVRQFPSPRDREVSSDSGSLPPPPEPSLPSEGKLPPVEPTPCLPTASTYTGPFAALFEDLHLALMKKKNGRRDFLGDKPQLVLAGFFAKHEPVLTAEEFKAQLKDQVLRRVFSATAHDERFRFDGPFMTTVLGNLLPTYAEVRDAAVTAKNRLQLEQAAMAARPIEDLLNSIAGQFSAAGWPDGDVVKEMERVLQYQDGKTVLVNHTAQVTFWNRCREYLRQLQAQPPCSYEELRRASVRRMEIQDLVDQVESLTQRISVAPEYGDIAALEGQRQVLIARLRDLDPHLANKAWQEYTYAEVKR